MDPTETNVGYNRSPPHCLLLGQASEAMAAAQWDIAIDRLRRVLHLDPENEEACEGLARCFAVRGLLPGVIDQYFALMDVLERKGDFDPAVQVANWIISLQPDNEKARIRRILLQHRRCDTAGVVRESLDLARVYMAQGRGDQSILVLEGVLHSDPSNLDVGMALVDMFILQGLIQEGAMQLGKMANMLEEQGRLDKAADALRRMKSMTLHDPGLLLRLGHLYVSLGLFDEAEAEFRDITRSHFNHLDALLALADVCQQKGKLRDAMVAYKKIAAIDPMQVAVREKLGTLCQAQGDLAEAASYYLAAAHHYLAGGDVARSMTLYQCVVDLDPWHIAACRGLQGLGVHLAVPPLQRPASPRRRSRATLPRASPNTAKAMAKPRVSSNSGKTTKRLSRTRTPSSAASSSQLSPEATKALAPAPEGGGEPEGVLHAARPESAGQGGKSGAGLSSGPTLASESGTRYRIQAVVGEGGMGVVYEAFRVDDGNLRVAIKVLTERAMDGRFWREVRLCSTVQHPSLVKVLDWGFWEVGQDKAPFMVMEFVSGRTLRQVLDASGPVDPNLVSHWMRQVLQGLAVTHKAGIVHRDIKPENLMLTDSGGIKILDLGLAHEAGQRLTAAGMVVGTPQYMSLEQLQGSDVTGESDLYSLGVVAFELLTGVPPIVEPDLWTQMTRIAERKRPELRDLNPAVPDALSDAVMQMIDPVPTRRWPARWLESLGVLP